MYIGLRSALRQDSLFDFLVDVRTLGRSTSTTVKLQKELPPSPLALGNSELLNELSQLVYVPGRDPVIAPRITPKTMVLFVLGQSNASNYGELKHTSFLGKAYQYFDGLFYVAKDPLLGAAGDGGSIWTLLSNKLVDSGVTDQVVVIASGAAGSPISAWTADQPLGIQLQKQLNQLHNSGLTVTHFLWQQGEADYDTDANSYLASLTGIIDQTKYFFPSSNFVVAQSVKCGYKPYESEVPSAQRKAATLEGVFLGPNSDDIGSDGRNTVDECHFNGEGQERLASLWLDRIKELRKS